MLLHPFADLWVPHSFPTRRSSDLLGRRRGGGAHPPAAGAGPARPDRGRGGAQPGDRKSTRLNSSHVGISYAVFCLKKKNRNALDSRKSEGEAKDTIGITSKESQQT